MRRDDVKNHIPGANGDRVLRPKQGAVRGAALRFSQGRSASRSENRPSARGSRLPVTRALQWRNICALFLRKRKICA